MERRLDQTKTIKTEKKETKGRIKIKKHLPPKNKKKKQIRTIIVICERERGLAKNMSNHMNNKNNKKKKCPIKIIII